MYVQLLKSFNRLHPRAWDFIQLMRLDRPIGIYLLLWPTLWALWIAGDGTPSVKNMVIFVLGVILMRSAGCAINDFADRGIDGDVARTKGRPIVTGRVSAKEALITFATLVGISLCLVLLTNSQTLYWAFLAVGLAALYPFTKRYTHYPQVALGAAYSCSILLAFSAETGTVPAAVWLIYIANLLWTIAYDTYYAMSDREDDLKIGVKSTAVLFGKADRAIILSLQACALFLLLLAGQHFSLGGYFHLGLLGAVACFMWEFIHTRQRDAESSLRAFLHNHWAGFAIFLGIVAHYSFAA
ncbi:MAG: 4-hydroxybenzoate octaprenyltransferase [Pseudomonas sp.]|jgi:4-hydroxybenzoate polyprenyltransferase|nr:4-hydroxybenzoate octaprenyltransferase [Pseudomonas sp.]MDD2223066.1 4-hydroxybenzoate octaprenyltransferase [Pseudomonas sp.]MDY0414718.1 4-hydroxybenzoate octaprenyltransferase [Pseudomonas sp.]NLO53713.1 4-hydroxybenzoate octaprenyltransferase [Gammaproteobacteria bacterium]